MRVLDQLSAIFVMLLVLLLYAPGSQLLHFGGVFTSALANRLSGPGDFFIVAQRTGEAFSVGENAEGQLGLGRDDNSVDFPLPVKNADGVMSDVVGVCAGDTHACVRRASNSQVACSGQGKYLGQGFFTPSSNIFINVAALDDQTSRVSNLFCGMYSTFALNNVTGKAWAWGRNSYSSLGVGQDDDNVYSPTLIPVFGIHNKVIQIDSGNQHACFLTAAGKVLCSGTNDYGALGGNIDDKYHDVNVPTAVVFNNSETTIFTSVSCGYSHTCASDTAGNVWCWGDNRNGQQAIEGDYLRVILPTVIPGVQDAKFVWCGRDSVFAVLNNDGTALAWGWDDYGVFDGKYISDPKHTPMPFARGVGGIKELQGGYRATCIINMQDQVQCVGRNDEGQLGVGPDVTSSLELLTWGELITKAPTPARTRAPAPATTTALRKRLAGQGEHYLVLQLNGDVFTVGLNEEGQLGLGIANYSVDFPQIVPGVFDVVDVSAGGAHSCLLLGPGREVMCAGDGVTLGRDSEKHSYVFLPAIGLDASTGVTDVFCGYRSTFALNKNTGQVWAWGDNWGGLLGLGSSGRLALIPALIPAFGVNNKVIQINAGGGSACFLTAAGKVLCSGRNNDGVLGGNIADDDYWSYETNVPAAVVFAQAESTTFTSVSCGGGHTCASDSTGSVWCWGSNRHDQIIDHDHWKVLQPTLIPGVQGVNHVRTGYHNVFAVLTNGTALVWGQDYYGDGLFGGEYVSQSQRTPILFAGGVGSIVELQGGYLTTCILTTQDEVRCVGSNDYGQFGVGPSVSYSLELMTMGVYAPTRGPTVPRTRAPAPSNTLRKRLAGLGKSYLVVQLSGDVFAMGYNGGGELGLDTDDYYINFPQQVPDIFDVVDASMGDGHSCLLLGPGREVVCAGVGDQLGQGMDARTLVFLPAVGLDASTGVTDVFCGPKSTFALNTNTGQAWAWGQNSDGLLGLGHNGDIFTPTLITAFGPANKVIQMDSGSTHACFLTDVGKVLCAGLNNNGALGVNDVETGLQQHVPTAVVFGGAASTIFTSVTCGSSHTCASDMAGNVWCWGSNENGEQAQEGKNLLVLQPTMISGVQDVRFVWAGYYNVFTVLNNGSALAWGQDNDGVFGINNIPGALHIPVSYGQGVSGIAEIRGGSLTSCILTAQNEVQCTGLNRHGQLGVGRNVRSSLVLLTMGEYATRQPTLAPTKKSTLPTKKPTLAPTKQPTLAPTKQPTLAPNKQPTLAPTKPPTLAPTKQPTSAPTKQPTFAPTKQPTQAPTAQPTLAPTTPTPKMPTKRPTSAPTARPTSKPTKAPTKKPTKVSTKAPSKYPTKAPTNRPTKAPTKVPSKYPTKAPSQYPTKTSTMAPTQKPTTKYPTMYPTKAPTSKPTVATE